jgi:hypothetical protein
MIYAGTIDQRHMAAYLDQLPADQYAAERLDRSLIELAGRVARGCIRGVVTGILSGDEKTADWAVLSGLTSYEQAQILESGTSAARAAEMRRVQSASNQQAFRKRRMNKQVQRVVTDAQASAQARADAGDVPDQEAH